MFDVRTLVVDTFERRTLYSQDRLVGHLVRRGVPGELAVRYGAQVTDFLLAAQPVTVTTNLLRHLVTDLQEPEVNFADVTLRFGNRIRQTRGPLLDHRVRVALNHAVDRQAVMAALGREVSDSWSDPFPYDPALSTRLLKTAKFSDGFEVSVITPAHDLAKSPGFQLVSAQLDEIGVKLVVEIQPWSSWIERIRSSQTDGQTMYYAGSGIFLGSLDLKSAGIDMTELYVRTMLRDLIEVVARSTPGSIARLVFATSPISMVPGGSAPSRRALLDRRRMQVWMWEDGWESLVCLVGWWPAFATASRIDYAESIDEVISDTLDDAVSEGACFEQLEIMSHGNTGRIKMGDTGDNIRLTDFDASGNPSGKTKDLLDALKSAMCPAGHLSFTACNQGNGDLLRKISAYLQNAITVSGFSGTGYPDLVPGGDVVGEDLHFQNGSTASGPP